MGINRIEQSVKKTVIIMRKSSYDQGGRGSYNRKFTVVRFSHTWQNLSMSGKCKKKKKPYRISIMCLGCDCDERMDRPSRILALKMFKNNTCLVSIFHLPFLAPLSAFITIIWTYIYIQQTLWNRDVNASRNIRSLFNHMNLNHHYDSGGREGMDGTRCR